LINIKKAVLIISFVFVMCFTFGFSSKIANYIPDSKNISLKTNSKDLKVIANQIMRKYFEEFKKDKVKKEFRLKDYKIIELRDFKGNITNFRFYIIYSLEAAYKDSYIYAGNGEIKGLWCINKSLFVCIKKFGNVYKITNMGTGL
jgi:hypothetical protein